MTTPMVPCLAVLLLADIVEEIMNPEVRLVIALILGGMAGFHQLRGKPTEEEKKAAGWTVVIVTVVSWIFIKVLVILCAMAATVFLVSALGPRILDWFMSAKADLHHEFNRSREPRSRGMPAPSLEDLRDALEKGASHEVILEMLDHQQNRNGKANEIARRTGGR